MKNGGNKAELEQVVFYTVNDDYIEYLRKIDDKVLFNKQEKNARPYAGFLIKFNNMIPVRDDLINRVIISEKQESKKEEDYKALLIKEILFCSENKERLIIKSNKTMRIFNENRPHMKNIILSCCCFSILEKACNDYVQKK